MNHIRGREPTLDNVDEQDSKAACGKLNEDSI